MRKLLFIPSQLASTFRRLMAIPITAIYPTNKRRWTKVAFGGTPSWDSRNQIIGSLIPKGSSVIDLGCGAQTLRKYIPQDCTYQPCDLVKSSPDVITCNFNAGLYPQTDHLFSHVVCSGVLEYVQDPEAFLKHITRLGTETIMSYNPMRENESRLHRMTNNWINHFSQSSLEALFKDLHLSWNLLHSSSTGELIYKLRAIH